MKEQVLKQSQVFWKGLEQADTAAMRSVCDDKCFFVHIGGNCVLDREMDAFEKRFSSPRKSSCTARKLVPLVTWPL